MNRCFVYVGLVVAVILAQVFSFGWVITKWDLTNIKSILVAILIPIVTVLTIRYLYHIIRNRNNIWN